MAELVALEDIQNTAAADILEAGRMMGSMHRDWTPVVAHLKLQWSYCLG